jgi:hypothetical protein
VAVFWSLRTTLFRLGNGVTVASRPRLPAAPRRQGTAQAWVFRPALPLGWMCVDRRKRRVLHPKDLRSAPSWSSGFCPPHCCQASQALSLQYYPWICHPLPPGRFGVSSSGQFSNASGSFLWRQSRRASLGKTRHLPVSRPASPQGRSFPDIGSRSATTARPPSLGHIAGSLFATYTGSASCFLQTFHFWRCPCLVGVTLPSGWRRAFYFPLASSFCEAEGRRSRHARRTFCRPALGPVFSLSRAFASGV